MIHSKDIPADYVMPVLYYLVYRAGEVMMGYAIGTLTIETEFLFQEQVLFQGHTVGDPKESKLVQALYKGTFTPMPEYEELASGVHTRGRHYFESRTSPCFVIGACMELLLRMAYSWGPFQVVPCSQFEV